MDINVERLKVLGWDFYKSSNLKDIINNCGKWMYFFDAKDYTFAEEITQKAVKEGWCEEAKHTSKEFVELLNHGVCCFYCDSTNIQSMKKIISFFLNNNLIRRTKKGKLYNISFKRDEQTREYKYGSHFVADIKLNNFIDLDTGKFII